MVTPLMVSRRRVPGARVLPCSRGGGSWRAGGVLSQRVGELGRGYERGGGVGLQVQGHFPGAEVVAVAVGHRDVVDRVEWGAGLLQLPLCGVGGAGEAGAVFGEEGVDEELVVSARDEESVVGEVGEGGGAGG